MGYKFEKRLSIVLSVKYFVAKHNKKDRESESSDIGRGREGRWNRDRETERQWLMKVIFDRDKK